MSRVVHHAPEWEPADLPINAAGDTRPGFVCVHPLENGNGPCGANVFRIEDAIGDCACVVPEWTDEAMTIRFIMCDRQRRKWVTRVVSRRRSV